MLFIEHFYRAGNFMFYVYVLKCKDGSFYTGYTNNLKRRLKLHNEGKASKYTRSRLPVEIIAYWAHETKGEALRAEVAFKKLSKSQKYNLINKSMRL